MMHFFNAAILFLVLSFSYSAKLPLNFSKCERKSADFLQCTPKAVEDAMKQLNAPIRELGIPSLNPMEVTELTVQAGTSAVGLQQKYKNLRIYGVNNLTCSKMDVDFEKKTIKNLCHYPEIRIEADYELDGKILLLDVRGKGPGDITLENVDIGVSYEMDEYQKNGKKHFKVREISVRIVPEKVHFHIKNGLEGFDQSISDNILKVLNENWEDVFEDVKPNYEDAFGQIIKTVFNRVLSKVPLVDIFGEE